MSAQQPDFRRTDRTDAPHYLARYTERARKPTNESGTDDGVPLYLRRFRERQDTSPTPRRSVQLEVDGERFTRQYAEITRSHEIIPPPEIRERDAYVTEIRIIRHGITQGYSTDAGLTPMGGWQAHQRGHALAK
ncbi:MAG: histidine phosphatase family protein, partial [Sciscionella sp.]